MKKFAIGFVVVALAILGIGCMIHPTPIKQITDIYWSNEKTNTVDDGSETYEYSLYLSGNGEGTYTEYYTKEYSDTSKEPEWLTREETFDWRIDSSDAHVFHATYLNYKGDYDEYNIRFSYDGDKTLELENVDTGECTYFYIY